MVQGLSSPTDLMATKQSKRWKLGFEMIVAQSKTQPNRVLFASKMPGTSLTAQNDRTWQSPDPDTQADMKDSKVPLHSGATFTLGWCTPPQEF